MKPLLFSLSLLPLLLLGAEAVDTTPPPAIPPQEHNLTTAPQKEHIDAEDEKLRLMFQVFTYASDLDNAYKVGTKALKRYPDSLHWHQKMAEICQWLGKRSEAVKHYSFVYHQTHDKELEKKILDYALNAYQYEAAAPILESIALADPSRENLEKLVDIYDKVGTPEKAAAILEQVAAEKPSVKSWALLKALQIYVETGDQKQAKHLVEKLEKRGTYDLETGEAIADYYMTRGDISASYKALHQVDPETLGDEAAVYYRQLSDMGWYLQDRKASVLASSKLFALKKARPIDYERIIGLLEGKKPEFVKKVAMEGYRKFGKKYLYLSYIGALFTQKQYAELVKAIESVSGTAMGKELASDVNTWLMLAQAYGALDENDKAVDAFRKAIALDPHSAEIEAALLWYFIDHKRIKELKEAIFQIEEEEQIPQALWLPLAVGNFSLQRADRAMGYIKRLMDAGQNGIDIQFMYAYLMQAREETGAFMMTMEHIFDTLEAQRKRNPSLMRDPRFVENYLKSGMYFIPVDQFEAELERAKTILTPKSYTEIAIFQALRHNTQDRAKFLAAQLKEVEPWMQLNIALADGNGAKLQSLLYRFYEILPIRDRVTAGAQTKNIALSQTLAFEGLEQNRYDYLLYQQMRDLTEQYANWVKTGGALQQRSELDRSWLSFSARYYLENAWTLYADAQLVQNRIRDHETLAYAPNNESLFKIGLQRRFMKGNISFEGGVRSAMETYPFAKAHFHYEPISRFSVDADLGLDILSDETTYLLIGGKKNEIKLEGSFQYLPSTALSLALTAQRLYSQDDYYLGKGYRARLQWYKQLRSGYPDLAWGLFAEYGWYEETEGTKGNIEEIIFYEDTLILPETYYTVGTTFSYGMANKEYFTRVWRPYASVSPYYNGLLQQLSFSFDAGLGGEIYDRDHLTAGISYDHSVNGTQESNLQIYIRYKHFFQ